MGHTSATYLSYGSRIGLSSVNPSGALGLSEDPMALSAEGLRLLEILGLKQRGQSCPTKPTGEVGALSHRNVRDKALLIGGRY